jgi:D-hydroxyproline dehydrogenase subunit gamma
MFRRLPDLGGAPVTFTFDGRSIAARSGDTIAAALLAAGVESCRTTPVSGAPRAPYCMMGVCFECLVVVDGVGNRQGCLVAVRDGMRVETQRGHRAMVPVAEGVEA